MTLPPWLPTSNAYEPVNVDGALVALGNESFAYMYSNDAIGTGGGRLIFGSKPNADLTALPPSPAQISAISAKCPALIAPPSAPGYLHDVQNENGDVIAWVSTRQLAWFGQRGTGINAARGTRIVTRLRNADWDDARDWFDFAQSIAILNGSAMLASITAQTTDGRWFGILPGAIASLSPFSPRNSSAVFTRIEVNGTDEAILSTVPWASAKTIFDPIPT